MVDILLRLINYKNIVRKGNPFLTFKYRGDKMLNVELLSACGDLKDYWIIDKIYLDDELLFDSKKGINNYIDDEVVKIVNNIDSSKNNQSKGVYILKNIEDRYLEIGIIVTFKITNFYDDFNLVYNCRPMTIN